MANFSHLSTDHVVWLGDYGLCEISISGSYKSPVLSDMFRKVTI